MDCICDKFVMVEDGEVFEMSQAAKGDPGPGVAPGGTTGQLLAKASDEDYDTEWIDQPEMDAEHVSYDSSETYSDGTVGKELGTINSALSSLSSVTEIIDTASGAIASFPDGSGLPMRSLLATIEPQQEGSGDPSPENVRPITGWTGLSGERLGVNQWDETWEQGSIDNSTGEDKTAGSGIRCVGYIPVASGASYYIYTGDNIPVRYYWYDSAKAFLSSDSVRNGTITAPSNAKYLRIRSTGDYGNTYKNNWSVNYPSTVTTYEAPVTPLPITVSWQSEAGTVYGGTVDVVTGVLTVDRGIIDLSTLTWNRNQPSGATFYRYLATISGATGENNKLVCSDLAIETSTAATSQKNGTIKITSTGEQLVARLDSCETAAAFTTAMSGVMLVYPLATPQTYQLTPQQISTLLGNNTVFVDCGSVSVTYQASIKGYIDKVLAS